LSKRKNDKQLYCSKCSVFGIYQKNKIANARMQHSNVFAKIRKKHVIWKSAKLKNPQSLTSSCYNFWI